MIDVERRGAMTHTDLSEAMNKVLGLERETGVIVNRDDLYLIFRRYETKGQGQLAFSDFCNLVLPQSKEYAALLNGR
jgi:Ca2+-binding EF-hand superfamily protein